MANRYIISRGKITYKKSTFKKSKSSFIKRVEEAKYFLSQTQRKRIKHLIKDAFLFLNGLNLSDKKFEEMKAYSKAMREQGYFLNSCEVSFKFKNIFVRVPSLGIDLPCGTKSRVKIIDGQDYIYIIVYPYYKKNNTKK